MKQFVLVIFFIVAFFMYPVQTNAITMPCSLVLEPVDSNLKNAKGVALGYKVQIHPPSFARTSVSILAVHLPEPSSFGNYDRYEGFAYIPDEISWRFKIYLTPEKESPTWAGRFDLITAKMKDEIIQVRLSNSETKVLGPSVLTYHMKNCK